MMAAAAAKPALKPGQKKKKQIYDVNVTIDLVSVNALWPPGQRSNFLQFILFHFIFRVTKKGNKITSIEYNIQHMK